MIGDGERKGIQQRSKVEKKVLINTYTVRGTEIVSTQIMAILNTSFSVLKCPMCNVTPAFCTRFPLDGLVHP